MRNTLLWGFLGCCLAAQANAAIAEPVDGRCQTHGQLAEADGGSAVLVCSGGKWKDMGTLGRAAIKVSIVDSRLDESNRDTDLMTFTGYIGVPIPIRLRVGGGVGASVQSLDVVAEVMSFDRDGSAPVALDITGVDSGQQWHRRVDAVVPVGVKTVVAQNAGASYSVTVMKPGT
jgi:hypothetical protein